MTDIRAAHLASVQSIGYASQPGKRERLGSPYLTGVPLARFPCRDSLEGPDRYGALATSRDRRRGRR